MSGAAGDRDVDVSTNVDVGMDNALEVGHGLGATICLRLLGRAWLVARGV